MQGSTQLQSHTYSLTGTVIWAHIASSPSPFPLMDTPCVVLARQPDFLSFRDPRDQGEANSTLKGYGSSYSG